MNSMNLIYFTIMILLTINLILNMNNKMLSNKNSMNNIECGFNYLNNKKLNISMNFMYILIIFILFDIEIMILIPLIINMTNNMKFLNNINIFIMFMIMTTLIEMKNKKINWLI